MNRWIVAFVALGLQACAEPPPDPERSSRRGLWVLAEGEHRTLEDPERIERLVADAVRLGVSDLFVQLYRRGRSWYPSTHADPSPHERLQAASGDSPLRTLIDRAHSRQLKVHGWINALSLHGNREAPLLRALGPSAVLVDREGRNLLDYPGYDVPAPDREHLRLGTPGIWLDPAVPAVVAYLEAIIDDLVRAAPDLDGLHLDFIRYPLALPLTPGSRFDVGLDFGYGAEARSGFERARGRAFARGNAWDSFRREQVTELVRRLAARVPFGWERSAAVLPWADRAYLTALQDWRLWLDEGLLDFAVAMAYTTDDALLRYLAHGLRGGIGGDRVWIGLGSWLLVGKPERLRAQLDIALAPSPAGVAFFSYDALAGKAGAMDALRETQP